MIIEDKVRLPANSLTKVKINDLVDLLNSHHIEIDSFGITTSYHLKGDNGKLEINLKETDPGFIMIELKYDGNGKEKDRTDGVAIIDGAIEVIDILYKK